MWWKEEIFKNGFYISLNAIFCSSKLETINFLSKTTENTEPLFFTLWTEIWPLLRVTYSFTSASPNPLPSYFRVCPASSWEKGEKRFFKYFSDIPIPVSLTFTIILFCP